MTPPPSRSSFAFIVVGELPEGMTPEAVQRLVAMFSVNAEVIPHCRASFLRAMPDVPVPALIDRLTAATSRLAVS